MWSISSSKVKYIYFAFSADCKTCFSADNKDFRGTEIEQRLKDQGKIWYLVSGSKTQPTSSVGF